MLLVLSTSLQKSTKIYITATVTIPGNKQLLFQTQAVMPLLKDYKNIVYKIHTFVKPFKIFYLFLCI